ncbi:MAG: cytochrome c [Devosia sp.]|jgi:mono/diheme cytochrome c family protein|uniref:c-type cytochrome n=1 Tax=unclassified Devosia TaxID=196773 RepID=UPI0019EABF5F|nr:MULTISPECIES: cytochrome c [unclassified Devosia]MBF0678257.1 cytochrome c [Devosia sp.]WEJ31514.1 cytochrome c [Devosia sp. SD17-2]
MTKDGSRRLLRSVIGVLAGSGALFATLGMVSGYERPGAGTLGVSAPKSETRILLAQAATEVPVSFTSDQVDRGKTQFQKDCVECHGEDLRGGLLGGPPLRGVNFLSKFGDGAPAGVLYDVMSGTMPPDAPGRYSPGAYADMMAYILQRNGFPSSGQALPTDSDALYNMIIE